MPEHLRALLVVLALSTPCWFALNASISRYTTPTGLRTWSFLWFGVTVVAFLASTYWVVVFIVGLLLLPRRLTPVKATAIWCLLFLSVPSASINVPGFGLINYFISLNHPQLLTLVLLLPAAFSLAHEQGNQRFGTTVADKLLLAYLLLVGTLQLREANFTSTLRGCYYLYIGTFIPYYVASRSLKSVEDFKQIMLGFIAGSAILGVLVVFETLKHWNLYAAMTSALGLTWGYTGYLSRDGLLRASGSVGQAIVLGYIMAVGLGFWLFFHSGQKASSRNSVPLLMMFGGLLASLSRGPWVGAAIILMIFTLTGARPFYKLFLFIAGSAACLGALSLTGSGRKILNFLPFVGQVDSFNVEYRRQLLENALSVIGRNFWFGSVDYIQSPEMQRMIQGQGIIDIVNSYIGVALNHGVIGLGLFFGFFAIILFKLWKAQKSLPQANERRRLGRALLATLFGIVTMISAVSSVVVIPIVYWLVAGMCVAYLEMLKHPTPETARTAA